MSLTQLCRLCLNVCNDSKSLYFKTGQVNEIYEIAVNYFHPMFLSADENHQNTVICLECWHHISDFHSYQQSVFQAQQKLLHVDPLREFQSVESTSFGGIASNDNSINGEGDKDSISLPDIEIMEDRSFVDVGQNDEPSNETICSPEISDNMDVVHCGLYDVKREEQDTPGTSAELRIEQSLCDDDSYEGNENFNSDVNQMINAMKCKRRHRKSQTELDSFISQWRPNLECVVCGELITSFTSLQQHFRLKHPTDQCYISCCNRKFNTRCKIEEHARFHIDPNAFKCLKCGSKLGSEASLYIHNRKCQHTLERAKKSYTKTPLEEIDNFIALYKPNLECEVCHESCSSFTLLKLHFRNNHPGVEGYVKCCQRNFSSRSEFKDHTWLHMDPDAFKCNICHRHQKRYKHLQFHMERMHSTSQKNIRPEDIGISAEIKPNKNTTANENTNQHHLSLDCSRRRDIVQQENLNIAPQYNPKISQEVKPNGNKHYNEFDEILSVWKPILECSICGESCRTYTKFQDHFHQKHPNTNCYFICCQQQLQNRPEIEEHMRLHRDPNVYKCHICGNSYNSRQTLREHMVMLHPELGIRH